MLILSGDQLYRMDFRQLLKTHRDDQGRRHHRRPAGAARTRSPGFGIVRLDDDGPRHRLRREAADRRAARRRCARRPSGSSSRGIDAPRAGTYLASMGIYLFKPRGAARPAQRPAAGHRLRQGDLPAQHRRRTTSRPTCSTATGRTSARSSRTTRPTWPWPATNPPFDFHSPDGVIYTRMRYLPAVARQRRHARAVPDQRRLRHRSRARRIERCVIGVRSRIGRNVHAARHRHHRRRPLRDRRRAGRQPRAAACPNLGIGDGTRHRARHPRQGLPHRPQRAHRQPAQASQDDEGDNYVIRDGIVVIPTGRVVPDGTVI